MTLMTAAQLAMGVLYTASNALVAIVLPEANGWRSLVPFMLMCLLVERIARVEPPRPALFAVGIAACVVTLVARGPRLRALRVGAVVVCSLVTATVQVMARL